MTAGGAGGPLAGVRVVELAGLGAAPFGCLVLADLGAEVVEVRRPGGMSALAPDVLSRGRTTVVADLKTASGRADVVALAAAADVLVDSYRPGVAERLGVGPADCTAVNPRLVYARMTGWGQDGPLAPRAGHDINYLAVSGVLGLIGSAGEAPVPPLNLVGDFGGGGMLLVLGVLAALLERERSGQGQVIDVAMVDGAALLSTFVYGLRAQGLWDGPRGTNLLDGGAPFYTTYRTADDRYLAVGALEPQFYAALLERLGLTAADLPAQHDRAGWPRLRERFAAAFAARTRAEWEQVFDGSDACVSPVLGLDEAPTYPHNAVRRSFPALDGDPRPAPAPRFSRTPAAARPAMAARIADVLARWTG